MASRVLPSRPSKGSREQQSLPNILLLVTDQFRYDAFGPETTPNLYRLATNAGATATKESNRHPSRSTLFRNAYSSTPTCTPARAALLTGKSPWNHGMLGYADAVDCQNYATTLPSVLKDLLGYDTAVVGKNHFGTRPTTGRNHRTADSGEPPGRRPFVDHGYRFMELYEGLTQIPDDYEKFFRSVLPGVDPLSTCHLGWNDWEACPYAFEEYLHPTAWTTRTALTVLDRLLERKPGNHPLLLKVSYHRPHSPYDPPRRLWDKHHQRARNNSTRYERNVSNDPAGWDREFFREDMPPSAWHGDPGKNASRTSRVAYLANVEFVDEGIGSILDRLREHGKEDNTVVVWVSDHGDMNGDHNLWRKGYPWEASSRIHMVVRLPSGLAAATTTTTTSTESNQASSDVFRTSDAIVELRDVAPTIYDLLGVLETVTERDPLVNGKSLLPVLRGRSETVRSHLDLEHSTVYDDRIHWNALVGSLPPNTTPTDCALYKYVFFAGSGREQLFCLSEDPLEQHDLAVGDALEHGPVLDAWRTTMAKNFATEGRGENWVTPDGRLAIRTQGTTLGPNYPCPPNREEIPHEENNDERTQNEGAKRIGKTAEASGPSVFFESQRWNGDRQTPRASNNDRSRNSPSRSESPYGIDASLFPIEERGALLSVALFLSLWLRYFYAVKRTSHRVSRS